VSAGLPSHPGGTRQCLSDHHWLAQSKETDDTLLKVAFKGVNCARGRVTGSRPNFNFINLYFSTGRVFTPAPSRTISTVQQSCCIMSSPDWTRWCRSTGFSLFRATECIRQA
jgi:hypothetical protein